MESKTLAYFTNSFIIIVKFIAKVPGKKTSMLAIKMAAGLENKEKYFFCLNNFEWFVKSTRKRSEYSKTRQITDYVFKTKEIFNWFKYDSIIGICK